MGHCFVWFLGMIWVKVCRFFSTYSSEAGALSIFTVDRQDLRKHASIGAFFEWKLRDGVKPSEGANGKRDLGGFWYVLSDSSTIAHISI